MRTAQRYPIPCGASTISMPREIPTDLLTTIFSFPLDYHQLYRARGSGIVFRWIKQHLRIKAFYGTSRTR